MSRAAAARQTQLPAPHLPGARSSWRQLLADKGAKCSAQVLLGKGRRAGREQKRDRGHGIGAVPGLLRSGYSTGTFSFWSQRGGL